MVVLVGIVGGIGSGKSAVSEQFQRLGAEILNGDQLGHEVLREADVIEELRGRWGDRILATDAENRPLEPAQIDRGRVARIVFDGPGAETELRYLESVIHPRIRARIRDRIVELNNELRTDNEPLVVILDAPLLIEAGWDELCDYIVFVECPREIRLQRVQSRGWDAQELSAREAYQLPIEAKREAAHWVIDNSGTLADLPPKIKPIWQRLTLPKRT